MMNQIGLTSLFTMSSVLILMINEFVYKYFNVKSEYSRKAAHVLATLSSLVFFFTISSHWYILFISLTFSLILFLGKQKNRFDSIDSVNRKTSGSYILPLAIYSMFLIAEKSDNSMFFILPILILGISDPLAGIFGTVFQSKTRKIQIGNYKFEKTILGSSMFFVSALIISLVTLYIFSYSINSIILISILIAFISTITELVSTKGVDNLSIPFSVLLVVAIF